MEGGEYDASVPQTVSAAGRPLWVEFGFSAGQVARESLSGVGMWRYASVLPDCHPVSLGEGGTPLVETPQLGCGVFVKDESVNPTATFKARGMSMAVSMAKWFGFGALAVPSAGNAGSALAAYSAAAGLEAHVFVPSDTPAAIVAETRLYGGQVTLVDGLITDCAAEIAKVKDSRGWFDMSTLKEPFRLEGKKTMGYELAEQFGWELPDVVVYPTGGGTGLIGMGKAFDEMERLGWIGPKRPRMVSVQAAGCAPIPTAFERGERFATEFENASTVASGLRVPRAVGDFLMLDLIQRTGGAAVTVTDAEMVAAAREMSARTGICACPEGGATLAAYRKLVGSGWIGEGESVVLFNTGSGLKYLDVLGLGM